MCSKSSEASSGEKTSAMLEYLVGIEVETSFATNTAICALWDGWTLPSWVLLGLSREITWTMKISYPGSRTKAANSFFPTSLTCLVVRSAFSMVYDLYQNFLFEKLTSAPLRVRKSIPKTISGLTFTTEKVSSKNLILLAWSVIEKAATIIP